MESLGNLCRSEFSLPAACRSFAFAPCCGFRTAVPRQAKEVSEFGHYMGLIINTYTFFGGLLINYNSSIMGGTKAPF